jgi:hypothetical protein
VCNIPGCPGLNGQDCSGRGLYSEFYELFLAVKYICYYMTDILVYGEER